MTNLSHDNLGNEYIRRLVPYYPGKPIEELVRERGIPAERVVKLASNENPLGMSPKARAALEAAMGELHRYPEQYALVQALAAHWQVPPEQVIAGNGSNDVLDLIARAYLGPGDEAVSSQYAFAIYQIATQSTGAQNIVVPAREYAHNLDAMLAATTPRTKVVWIANPNNPTGTFEPYDAVRAFLEAVPPQVMVVLDEAYFEYLPEPEQQNTLAWIAAHPNFIVVRTFSKIYGLAGLRVGYGIGAPQVIELLNRVRQPFNVGTGAVAAAVAALGDTDFLMRSREVNSAGLAQLQAGISKFAMRQLPAFGNFITFTPGSAEDAAGLNEYLLRQGVIVRPLGGYGMPAWLRVTAGTPEETSRFLDALASWQNQQQK